MKKKILIIQHHGKFGGASKSIFEYVFNLRGDFSFDIICPYGSTYNFFKKNKVNVFKTAGIPKYDITEIGLYKGFRKLLILRELLYLPIFIYVLFLLSKKKYDLVHLNDTNLIMIAPILKFFFKSKIICHIRTRVDKKRVPKLITLISKKFIDKYICIDQSTFSTSKETKKSTIIYNIFNQKKKIYKNKKKIKTTLTIGFLGTLDFHKGLDFLFECINKINKKKNNFKFLIGGDLSIKNNFLLKIIHKLKIKKNFNKVFHDFKNKDYKNVEFLGPVENLENFYSQIDLMCFPSRMNALGRPVIESSSFGIPSIVCLKNYFNDTIQDKKTGYVIKFGDKKKLLKFMYFLEKNRFKINILGRNAKKNFDLKHNTNINLKKLTDIYLKT